MTISGNGKQWTNTELLNKAIDESGYKKKYLAAQLGISVKTFKAKICNKSEFRVSEILALTDLLRLNSRTQRDIFLSSDVN